MSAVSIYLSPGYMGKDQLRRSLEKTFSELWLESLKALAGEFSQFQ